MENTDNLESALTSLVPYLAPEVLSKIPYDPMIADVFAFGVCLFIALNDSLPFGPSGKRNGSESSCSLKPQVEKSLSSEVKKCLKAMLQFDVNKRATSFALDREAWFQNK